MYYSIVCFPDIDRSVINAYRKKYDPYFSLIDIHITIVFPVPDAVTQKDLIEHVRKIAHVTPSFSVRLSGLERSWDNWLFLLVKEGKEELVALHDSLYTGLLASHLRKDIPYAPHVALGLFASKDYDLRNPKTLPLDAAGFQQGLQEAQALNLDYTCNVHSLYLVELNSEYTQSQILKEFSLKE